MAPKVAIIYWSMYGHIKQLADAEKAGIESAGGSVDVYQIKETLPQEVLQKMHAPAQDESIPFITPDVMKQYDAFLFGIPTRYGNYSAQWKTFIDQLGGLWMSQGLVGKYFGVFVSTATSGGGQESTALSSLSSWVHQGMIYVPLGYKGDAFPILGDLSEVRGGSPWGAGTFASGDGSRQPSEKEKQLATLQGKYFWETVSKSESVPDSKTVNAASNAQTNNGSAAASAKPSQPLDTDDKEEKSGPCGLPKGCVVS